MAAKIAAAAHGGATEGGQAQGSGEQQQSKDGKGKSHRRSNSGSSNGSAGSKGSKNRRKKKGEDGNLAHDYDPDYEYCTLCEVERMLGRVHSRPEEILDDPQDSTSAVNAKSGTNNQATLTSQEGPFVPEAFVSGFMTKVAPWFRRGIQEDSHEFLRLLIDAMQTSCKGARENNTEEGQGMNSNEKNSSNTDNKEDNEYPFRLFRGTVESNVKCSACHSKSCKIDPIEDIGLDILPIKSNPAPSKASSTRGSSSRSTSPTTHGMAPLADVTQALERFISSEHLDSGYKCEKCGKLGKAIKTSKLASIPPILTLHLKRFRYGSGGGGKRGGGGYSDNGATRSSRSARGGGGTSSRSLQTDFDNIGPSGSAKIEGHVRFGAVLDMKPYLTTELQRTVFQKMAICRLFAVVCHTGKNSHSGHYVAYVHNVTKRNEWWKMDDAKVVRSSWEEVQNAEAYMLFYRVTSHPVAMRLKSIADAKEMNARRVIDEMKRREEAKKAAEEAKKAEAIAAAKAAVTALQELVEKSSDDKVPDVAPSSDTEDPSGTPPVASPDTPALGKRSCPPLSSGEEWARVATTLSPEYLPLFTRIQEFITDNVTFSPEFFGYITEEYNRMSSKMSIGRRVKNNKRIKTLLGKGPGGVYPPEDVVGGAADIQGGIYDLFHQISIIYKANNKGTSVNGHFLLPKIEEEVAAETPTEEKVSSKNTDTAAPEVVPAMDTELLIPADNTESYDGAL